MLLVSNMFTRNAASDMAHQPGKGREVLYAMIELSAIFSMATEFPGWGQPSAHIDEVRGSTWKPLLTDWATSS